MLFYSAYSYIYWNTKPISVILYFTKENKGLESKRMKDLQEYAVWESDEEHYQEEERKKCKNCTNEEYDQYIEEEIQKANSAKARMCSVGRLPTTTNDPSKYVKL